MGIRLRDKDTGKVVIEVAGMAGQLVAENCWCVRRTSARTQLKQIPPVFGKPKLSRLRARPEMHPNQARAIEFVKAHPNDSFLLLGKNFTGKSHLAWALVREAIASRRSAVACSVSDLLYEFKRVEIHAEGETVKTPRVTAEHLRKIGKPWLIFLDEFEKAKPSEFASVQLFNLLDAAKSFNHQLVITSNMNIHQLRDHWSRMDEIWGNSIMTRLRDCHQVEMF